MDLLNAADGGVSLSTGDAWTDVGLSNGTSPGYNPGLHETSYPADIRHICFLVFFCATSVIAPIGIVGNVFSIVVFLSAANFRRTSTVQYLIGLAITDSLYLVGELFFTLSTPTPWGTYLTSVNFVYTTDSGCKLIMWLRYSAKLMSAWITVVIAFQRMLVITALKKVTFISTPNRARLLLSVLCLVCTAVTAYPMWTVGLDKSEDLQSACLIISETYYEWLIVTFTVGSLVLPQVLLIVCTSIIIYHLASHGRLHHQSARSVAGQTCQEAGTTDSSGIDQLQQQSSSSAQSTDRQLTVLLVTVCIVALLLQLPYIVLYNLNRSKYDWLSNDSEALEVLQEATYIALPLSTLNYAINFLLYNFSSSSFRRHVIALVRRQCWRRRLSNHKSRRSSAPTGESYVLMVTRNASCQPTASSAADERDTECKKQSLRESAIADAAAITSA